MAAERGQIRNASNANQVKDYSGLNFPGNITPTDLDGLIDFGGIAWVKMEFKYGAGILPYGQKLALQRLCDDCTRSGKPSLLIIARHHDTGPSIDCARAEVTECRWRYEWVKPLRLLTVRQAVDGFYRRHVAKAA